MRLVFRLILFAAGVVLAVVFMGPMSVITLNAGSVVGLMLAAVLILYSLLMGKLPRKACHVINGLLGCCLVFFIVMGIVIASRAVKKPQQEGTLVILGCRVRGNVPSLMLRSRIDAAADYLKAHPEAKAVCTGGQGSGEELSEGACIRRELIALGIAEDRLYLEDKSTSTSENLKFAKEIIDREGLNPHLIIVSNEFHLYRALHMAGRLGLSAESVAAATRLYLLPTYFVRESLAIVKEWILPDSL